MGEKENWASTSERVSSEEEYGKIFELTRADSKGNATPAESELLRRPETVESWYRALTELKREIEFQVTSKKALVEALECEFTSAKEGDAKTFLSEKANFLRWKPGAMRLKMYVERRIDEAKKLRTQYYGEGKLSHTAPSRTALNLLSKASELIPQNEYGQKWLADYQKFLQSGRNDPAG